MWDREADLFVKMITSVVMSEKPKIFSCYMNTSGKVFNLMTNWQPKLIEHKPYSGLCFSSNVYLVTTNTYIQRYIPKYIKYCIIGKPEWKHYQVITPSKQPLKFQKQS